VEFLGLTGRQEALNVNKRGEGGLMPMNPARRVATRRIRESLERFRVFRNPTMGALSRISRCGSHIPLPNLEVNSGKKLRLQRDNRGFFQRGFHLPFKVFEEEALFCTKRGD